MARHKSYAVAQDTEPALDISSLIDVCFLLLIYFLVVTTIQKREMDVPMLLPRDRVVNSDSDSIEPLFITVDEYGAISTGSGVSMMLLDTDASSRDLPLLTQQLVLLSATSKTPLVQINIHEMTAQQRVLDVLNALVGVGIQHVTFTDFFQG
jgi:biopolymer transport protein ExbD